MSGGDYQRHLNPQYLDLADLHQHLAAYYSHTGRPSVGPELMIRMLLVGYCFGIRSEHRFMSQFNKLRANNGCPRLAKKNVKRVLALIGAILLLAPALHAEEKCPVEVKLLLSPATTQTVIASLGFENKTMGRVYLFDTDALDLLMQGVIVRVRQGAKNDLTVKVRLPKGNQQVDNSHLRERFPCEIDRTRAGAYTSYAVGRKYTATKVPEIGNDIYNLLSASQIKLLHEAQVSIDWARVMSIANINLTKWETAAQSPSGKLALELWEWPAGKILELSAKAGPEPEASKYAELERLVKMKNLSLSASQDTKTSMVLETLAAHTSPPR